MKELKAVGYNGRRFCVLYYLPIYNCFEAHWLKIDVSYGSSESFPEAVARFRYVYTLIQSRGLKNPIPEIS